ncbi:hypothetical protein CEXT_566731 [Caerostris extrusa]|uniref:Uncharacterized protein n=1 Tax=Caerostris extrusa TaxID=172846 RepID=A0AAV4Q0L8_CAEEX|nr:hypothetical protein CEXT_566731 [Caerostris extrusa]
MASKISVVCHVTTNTGWNVVIIRAREKGLDTERPIFNDCRNLWPSKRSNDFFNETSTVNHESASGKSSRARQVFCVAGECNEERSCISFACCLN